MLIGEGDIHPIADGTFPGSARRLRRPRACDLCDRVSGNEGCAPGKKAGRGKFALAVRGAQTVPL
jgi:hypothetical protein